ncbi:MAG TPA: 2-C-methyl-D-erythritol 4-phosphate cytidylyltransferase [Thermoanaerobaculia bacterium]|jgi:2-C-methyl-D-erythritol 4-phosphate cytidylyltransferase
MPVLVIIPAAGSGSRFGGPIPKQFQPLAGRPLVQYVVERFLMTDVARIIVAIPEPLLTTIKQSPGDRVLFVGGGETRLQSVINAMKEAGDDCDVVAVHDAVRPFFRIDTFSRLIEAAREYGGAVPALPVSDTIHATRDGRLSATVDRSNLVAAQTPQCFRFEVLRDSLKLAQDEKFDATDEAGLAAHYGYHVQVLPGDPFNIKITRPEDLALAEAHFEEWSNA